MALRAGLPLRDMEMVQFHPTGLLAGTHTRMTGTVLEEGLRGAGGYLLNGAKERFMPLYDPLAERATRDFVSRAMYLEIKKGNTSPHGGLYISMAHLGPEKVAREFKGMVERCADCGFDLAGGLVEVVPTAHYMMGGVEFAADCSTAMPGLFVAGEDSGGVHGANRLGGNGVANSTVFGGVAGDAMARTTRGSGAYADPETAALDAARERAFGVFGKQAGDLNTLRKTLLTVMWDDVGIIRSAESLARGRAVLEDLAREIASCGVPGDDRRYNLTWMNRLNLENLILVSLAIAGAADARTDSRGAHFRIEHPQSSALEDSTYTVVHMREEHMQVGMQPVTFTRVRPGETLIGGPG
jgi:fumarate reductase flavoprotein subunit